MRNFSSLDENSRLLIQSRTTHRVTGYIFLDSVIQKHMFSFTAENDLLCHDVLFEHVCVTAMLGEENSLGWREMNILKDAFWLPEEEVHEIHPQTEEILSRRGFASEYPDKQRHLWRPKNGWRY